MLLVARRVTTGLNREDGRRLFCRFLAATPTHWYALTSNLFPAGATISLDLPSTQTVIGGVTNDTWSACVKSSASESFFMSLRGRPRCGAQSNIFPTDGTLGLE